MATNFPFPINPSWRRQIPQLAPTTAMTPPFVDTANPWEVDESGMTGLEPLPPAGAMGAAPQSQPGAVAGPGTTSPAPAGGMKIPQGIPLQMRMALYEKMLRKPQVDGKRAILNGLLSSSAAMSQPSSGNWSRDFNRGMAGGIAGGMQETDRSQALQQHQYTQLMKVLGDWESSQRENVKAQSTVTANESRAKFADARTQEAINKGQREAQKANAPVDKTTPTGSIIRINPDGSHKVVYEPPAKPATGKAADLKAFLEVKKTPEYQAMSEDEQDEVARMMGATPKATPAPKLTPEQEAYAELKKLTRGTPEYQTIIDRLADVSKAGAKPTAPRRATAGETNDAKHSAVETLYHQLNPKNLPPDAFWKEVKSGRIKWPVSSTVRETDMRKFLADTARDEKTIAGEGGSGATAAKAATLFQTK